MLILKFTLIMNIEIMLTRLIVRQRNLHIHAYPNYQALFRMHRTCVSFNGRLPTAYNRPLTDD